MNRLYFCIFVGISTLFITAVPALAQDSVSVTAEVDRTAISANDLFILTVTVSGNYEQLGEPQLPLLAGADVLGSSRSSQFSMVNGVVSARTIFTYRLQPNTAGTLTIEAITISVNGSTYHTEPITVQVTSGPAPTPAPDLSDGQPSPSNETPVSPNGLTGQDLFVEADVDNPRPFVGQQTIYRFRFYQAVNLFNQPSLDWPAFSGFWTENLTPNSVYEQMAAERRYRVTQVRQALFPTAAGRITIEPATLTIPGDFFSRDLTLTTTQVSVEVQPLPEPVPDDYAGAVGQFEISSWIDPTDAQANEPVTLFVRVQGTGNLTTLPDPTEAQVGALSDWRVYDPQVTTNVGQNGDFIQGDKLFQRLLVPRSTGNLNIPTFSLVYFDPNSGTYQRVETEPLTVRVALRAGADGNLIIGADGKQAITVIGGDIRHIKAAPPALATRHTVLLEQPIYWLGWFVPSLMLAGVWLWDRHRRRLFSDVGYARAQRARRSAQKRLARAEKQAREDEDAAYATVTHALNSYLGDKLNLSAAGLTHDAIRQSLAAKAVPNDLINRALICLDWSDSGRFAPVAAGKSAHELIGEARSVIAEFEQAI